MALDTVHQHCLLCITLIPHICSSGYSCACFVENWDLMRFRVLRKPLKTLCSLLQISVRFFENADEEVQQLKLRFYEYMIKLDQHEGSYLNVCR